jgi:hypothetical protein
MGQRHSNGGSALLPATLPSSSPPPPPPPTATVVRPRPRRGSARRKSTPLEQRTGPKGPKGPLTAATTRHPQGSLRDARLEQDHHDGDHPRCVEAPRASHHAVAGPICRVRPANNSQQTGPASRIHVRAYSTGARHSLASSSRRSRCRRLAAFVSRRLYARGRWSTTRHLPPPAGRPFSPRRT